MRHAVLVLLAAAALGGCVQRGADTGGEAAERWIDAVNLEDWPRACQVTDMDDKPSCERQTREVFDGERLAIRGPVREVEPGTERLEFTLREPPAGVGEISIVRKRGRYLVRWQAIR